MSAALSSDRAVVHIFLCLCTCGLILITLLKRKIHTSDCIKKATLDLHNSGWKYTSFCCLLLQFQNIWFKLCVHVCVCKPKDILFLFPDLCASLSPPPFPHPLSAPCLLPDCEDGGKMRPPSPLLILLYITLSKGVKVVSKRGSGMCPLRCSGSDSVILACSLS